MDALEKAKLALRKYIQENPEKVKKDLEEIRRSSVKEMLIEILQRNDLLDNKTYEQQADEILLLLGVVVAQK